MMIDLTPRAEADESEQPRWTSLFQPGGQFILDASAIPTAVWGQGSSVLWASGEATMVAALQGLGKSTLAQQLALGRAGVPEFSEVLGFPVRPGRGKVLYLAMDRPSQIRRSFRRMVGEAWRNELDQRLTVWAGPPPLDLAKNPGLLVEMCRAVGADSVIVDSLKDAAVKLTDDETGALWNRARQIALRDGVEVLELHHNRKQPAGTKAEAPTVDDVYGSTWLTSGCGSIILLTGAPGDPIVKLFHVKQPSDQVGPLTIAHDHEAGRSSVWHQTDLLSVVKASGSITAMDAASVLFDTDKPTQAEKEKARRKLDKLTLSGLLVALDAGDVGSKRAARWGAK